MKKILFLPLLRMQSGHHQVAEAIMDMFRKHTSGVTLKKVDLLSYTNASLEKMISSSYLKWIRYAPGSYNYAYKSFFYLPPEKDHSFSWYQHIFLKKMEQLLVEESPDLIVCTHGFPSFLISKLKKKEKCNAPVVNVYTDFFMNKFWGKEEIDFHLLPSVDVKEKLVNDYQIPEGKMIVTGIPVHEEIKKADSYYTNQKRPAILIAGGNSGLGGIIKLADELKQSKQVDFHILCGNNKKLYHEISSWNLAHIKPYPYLSSRSEMNKLYDKVDAMISKPGGVTVSEALRKRLPVFVHSALPGQEEINLKYLKAKSLVFDLQHGQSFAKQVQSVLQNPIAMKGWQDAINLYHKSIEIEDSQIVEAITGILDQQKNNQSSGIVEQPNYLQIARA